VALPDPQPGLVIRYAYLWRSDADRGLEEGGKDRPCAVVVAIRHAGEQIRVVVAPITHSPPRNLGEAVEVPALTKARLQLDHERSWVITKEVNIFTWPGPDLRLVDRTAPSKGVAYGYLPEKTTRRIVESLRGHMRGGRAAAVNRDEPPIR